MEFNSRKAVNDKLKKYDYLAKDEDYIEIVEWTNGEGYDVTINDDKIISLTRGQIDAINYLVRSLEYKSDDD